MNATTAIPRKAVYRLSIYLRSLQKLIENNIETISSEILATVTGVKPAQIRKDLAHFGQFGKPGIGYNIKALQQSITQVLGTSRLQPVILVGVGNLGTALLSYDGFAREGFEILAGFDINTYPIRSEKVSTPIIPMEKLPNFIHQNQIRMAIVCVPGAMAQSVANQLVAAGIEAILNFSPVLLTVPENVMVNNVNLAIELENLSYFLKE